MAETDPPSAGFLSRAREGDGFAQLVSAVESLRPGTRLLTDGQQTVLAEYEHIVEQLRPPTFTPPAPEISDFRAEGGKVKIFGKHLRQPVTVTIAGIRAPDFEVKEAGQDESPYIEAAVPENADAGPIVVLTSGGSCAAVRPFHRAKPADGDEPTVKRRARRAVVPPAPLAADKPAAKRPARRGNATRARPNANKPAPRRPART
jgi:hypothetical protein